MHQTGRHLLGIRGLSQETVQHYLQHAALFAEVNTRDLKKVPFLRGRTVANLFFEASTRTKISFDVAAKRLSADTIQFSSSGSSTSKGESLWDTVSNIEAMQPDFVVIRHSQSGAAHLVSKLVSGSVINAGDGWHEHPTQALLDAYTIFEHFKQPVSEGLTGLKIALIGDIKHSRVARSNMLLLVLLGAQVTVCGPSTMLPSCLDEYGVSLAPSMDDAIAEADVVMMLRIQKERMQSKLFPSEEEYFRFFGLSHARFLRMKKEAVVMHPGPINRGLEIAPEVADSARSLILRQAHNGVAVRMAVLYCLAKSNWNVAEEAKV